MPLGPGRILITGAAGFLGRRLTRVLLAQPGRSLTLVDRAALDHPAALAGDLTDSAFVDRLAAERFDSIFHLAASLTLEAEQDPAAAYTVNWDWDWPALVALPRFAWIVTGMDW